MIMTISIEDLNVSAIIGHYDFERKKPQTLVFNINFDIDASKAVISDKLEDTVDYKMIKQGIIKLTEESQFVLIEKLAQEVLNFILSDAKVLRATVKVDKPQALRFVKTVAVEVSGAK